MNFFEQKKPINGLFTVKTGMFKMVSWARFELTTDRLEGDCSIQLSYQDMKKL